MSSAASDIEQASGWRGKVLEKLLVHHIRAHESLDGRVCIISEAPRQIRTGPRLLGHDLRPTAHPGLRRRSVLLPRLWSWFVDGP